MEPPRRPQLTYDQALKRALVQAHDGFLALVAPELTWRNDLSTELPNDPREADLAWEVADAAGKRGILHVELQTKVEADIGERVVEYAVRLFRRHHLPVSSLVVFLRPARNIPAPPFRFAFHGGELRYDYAMLRLWELQPEQVLGTTQYPLWPLAVLMGRTNVERAVSIAERIAVAPLDRHDRSESTGLLILLAGIRISSQDLMERLRRTHMISDLLKESSFAEVIRGLFLDEEAEQIKQRAAAEGRAEGRAEGEAVGRAQGEAEGVRESIRTMLEARFGVVDKTLAGAIAGLDVEALKALLPLCATGTLDEVRGRLGAGG